VLRWAISERYTTLRPVLMEKLAKGEFDDIIQAITQLSLLNDAAHVKALLAKMEKHFKDLPAPVLL
jgi:hypothetical protein